ncbi:MULTISPECIES: hypothetical protein [unclassified Microcoleus]|uniref:hypothetical protein n=1 Tax=unclassified Microcoleus TaxID=2642155 RepID=UPI001E01BC3C|nr:MULTISPECIES: hypothetical protein [unclassified Microcoleus]MCC3589565.1 hypothetical protein [Microcoleus sp. PH2017_28_MFU_U_A]
MFLLLFYSRSHISPKNPIAHQPKNPIAHPPKNPIAHQSKNPIARQSKNPIAHPQKMRSHIHKKPDRPINPSTQKPRRLKPRLHRQNPPPRVEDLPDDFPSPNTLFVRGGGHCLCRRGF